jgi:uncharacterized protein (DUF302 family)
MIMNNPVGVIVRKSEYNVMAALDLPLKIIAWQDKQQMVYVTYNDASYIKSQYSLPENVSASLNIAGLISKVLS